MSEYEDRTFNGPHYTFVVLSRRDLKRFGSAEPFAAISITNPLLPEAELGPDAPCAEVLRLQFHDTGDYGQPLRDQIVMTPAHAEQILAFVERHRSTVRTWVCQCEAGVSRSAAVAAALSRILQGDDRFFFANFSPNRWVYRTLLDAHEIRPSP